MFLISACLCGVNCKYDGGNNLNTKVLDLLKDGKGILICPEQLGGLSTPRTPSEIVGGDGYDVLEGKAKVLSKTGDDVTKQFIKGAEEALRIAKSINVDYAVLKARSPSCGVGVIYDGKFNGGKVEGDGVTGALLKLNGIKVVTESEFMNGLEKGGDTNE